ncbi:hypothetical protein EJ06DRAFT_370741 [Trichodelitschia bisporula]|uniref:Uncharacterized protein n=1 Tax=Trichodelitschia bisporula TaxID=703511 RepID=A0A6G1I124_9PEZI|nr:hypothetical protein EJ06DRAFT_370741 [Trichodelitschia bisporula]
MWYILVWPTTADDSHGVPSIRISLSSPGGTRNIPLSKRSPTQRVTAPCPPFPKHTSSSASAARVIARALSLVAGPTRTALWPSRWPRARPAVHAAPGSGSATAKPPSPIVAAVLRGYTASASTGECQGGCGCRGRHVTSDMSPREQVLLGGALVRGPMTLWSRTLARALVAGNGRRGNE